MAKDHLIRAFLGFITFCVIGFALNQLSELFIPLTFAIVGAIIFLPLVRYLNKHKVPGIISLLLVVLILAIVVFSFGVLIYSSAKPLIAELPEYEAKLSDVLARVMTTFTTSAESLGLTLEDLDVNTLAGATSSTANAVLRTISSFLDFAANAGLVLLFMLFMLAGTEDFLEKIKIAYPVEQADKATSSLKGMGIQIRTYIGVMVVINTITGLITGLALWVLGVEYAGFWAVLAFLAGFIPNLGAIIAIGAPFMFSLLQFDNLSTPILVLVILSAIFIIIGSFIQPKFLASSLNLSALLILISLIFWGLIWGPYGMLLAVPLTTIIKIIFANVKPLEPISILMGSKTEV